MKTILSLKLSPAGYILVGIALLTLLAWFLYVQFKKVRRIVEAKKRAQAKVKELNTYNHSLISLIDFLSGQDVAAAIKTRIPGEVVLFGFNHAARILLRELNRAGVKVNYVIENNKTVRDRAAGLKNEWETRLITTEAALDILREQKGTGIVICVLRAGAFSLAQRLTGIFSNDVKIILLEEIIREGRS